MAQKLLPPELLLLPQIGLFSQSFAGWGFAPDPTGRAYSAPLQIRPLAEGVGPRGMERREGEEEGEEGGRRKEGKETKRGDERGSPTSPDFQMDCRIKLRIRSVNQNLLSVPRCDSSFGQINFYFAPKIWNDIPLSVRQSLSLDRFMRI